MKYLKKNEKNRTFTDSLKLRIFFTTEKRKDNKTRSYFTMQKITLQHD